MGVLAKARAAALATDKGRRRERSPGIERLKGHWSSRIFLLAAVRPLQLQQKETENTLRLNIKKPRLIQRE
ncbi:hypothetical protein PMIT1320_00538 [Prochlorococcus marinus str. MIT 1320]|nr:hypothetical protein PMIT1320_00538 [Prochlorococcus marinus str. MIT 1320]